MAVLDIFRQNKKDDEQDPVVSSIPQLPIRQLIDGERRSYLLKLYSHLRGTQHAHKRYDWDGRMLFGYDDSLDIPVDTYVPMKRRRPCISLRMGKVITKRFTTMVFGHDRFPSIVVDGDPDAEDYIREMAKAAKLRTKMVEARDKGGACGSVIISWGFADGRPVIDVHLSALVEVLEWQDYENRIPSKVFKAYDFRRKVYKPDGKPETKTFWCVRYWDTEVDRLWEAIPDEHAATPQWQLWPSTTIVHGHGSCPVVWVQNIADSDDIDGICDADGQHEDFDEMDRLASATERGTVANVDPTLVVKDKKRKDETVVRKGSGSVIYAPGGANYLELQGTAVEAAKSLLQSIKQSELDEAEVVLLDPEKLSGSGVSAASLKVRYAPMLAKCDLLRDQYAEAIVSVLKTMIETARKLQGDVKTTDEGMRYWSKIDLDPRVETSEETNEEGEEIKTTVEVERTPGSSNRISLRWPPYFPATWEDRKTAIESLSKATGNQQIVSQKTAVETLSPMMDIEDPEAEIERINEDQDGKDERAKNLFDVGAPASVEDPVEDPSDDQ